MGTLRWLAGGLIGGAVGVVVWVAVGLGAGYEVGWIAWGVGFLVGAGARYAAWLGGEEVEGFGYGIGAAALALGCIVLGKFIVFSALVSSFESEEKLQPSIRTIDIRYDTEAMIASMADGIVKEKLEQGETIDWPPGMTIEEASAQADYPPEIWSEGEARWKKLSRKEQEKRKQQCKMLAKLVDDGVVGIRGAEGPPPPRPRFRDFFNPFDALWFLLATITAYKIGEGTYGGD